MAPKSYTNKYDIGFLIQILKKLFSVVLELLGHTNWIKPKYRKHGNMQNKHLQNQWDCRNWNFAELTQPAIICSKLTKETLEQGVKYVQS